MLVQLCPSGSKLQVRSCSVVCFGSTGDIGCVLECCQMPSHLSVASNSLWGPSHEPSCTIRQLWLQGRCPTHSCAQLQVAVNGEVFSLCPTRQQDVMSSVLEHALATCNE